MDFATLTDDHIARRNQEMLRQRRSGGSVTDIAKTNGLTKGYASALLRELDLDSPSPRPGVKLSLDKAAIAAAYREDTSTHALAAALHVSYSTIYRVLKEQGVEMRPRGSQRNRPVGRHASPE